MSMWRIVRITREDPATGGLLRGAPETEAGGGGGEGMDHEGEMLFQRDPQLLRAAIHVGPVHGPGEALVLELLHHRADLEAVDAPPGPHQRARRHEAREIVAGGAGAGGPRGRESKKTHSSHTP